MRSNQHSRIEDKMMERIKEEKETFLSGDLQAMEESKMMRAVKEKEEMFLLDDKQLTENIDLMRTFKAEKEEMYDQQSAVEGNLRRTEMKEEEGGIHLRSDQQSTKEGQMMRTIKQEECHLDISTDGQDVGNSSEGHLISPPDYNAEDNGGGTQYYPGGNPITGNKHHRFYCEERSPDPSNPEEPSDRSLIVTTNIHQGTHCTNKPPKPFNLWESSMNQQLETYFLYLQGTL
ncbi:uncharacterized protein [Hyperolius riggenbachi]|uniref:uncharacterized protein n=1 Tax=Hyperolius riggenbachi TaxID=752182 RepID=UPI0035A33810